MGEQSRPVVFGQVLRCLDAFGLRVAHLPACVGNRFRPLILPACTTVRFGSQIAQVIAPQWTGSGRAVVCEVGLAVGAHELYRQYLVRVLQVGRASDMAHQRGPGAGAAPASSSPGPRPQPRRVPPCPPRATARTCSGSAFRQAGWQRSCDCPSRSAGFQPRLSRPPNLGRPVVGCHHQGRHCARASKPSSPGLTRRTVTVSSAGSGPGSSSTLTSCAGRP